MSKGKLKYEVVKWEEENNRGSCNTKWSGEDLNSALIVASHLFAKEIIQAECIEKGLFNPWEQKVDFSYAGKVRCRITVLEDIDPMDEARGKKPPIIKSFGDESIKIFQRSHLD